MGIGEQKVARLVSMVMTSFSTHTKPLEKEKKEKKSDFGQKA